MREVTILGPQVYTEDGVLHEASVTIYDGIIAEIACVKKGANESFIFPSSYRLVPGFIDLHVHGANHYDVMDATQEALTRLSQALAVEGVTGFLATTMTASFNQIENALCAVRDYMRQQTDGAAVLGVHLEGPFISPKKMGAQRFDAITLPDIQHVMEWQKKAEGVIKLVTLAPELPHALELIHYLQKHDMVVGMGHSDATYLEANKAISEGCHYATHLFNAMRAIQQREPGIVTAALLSEKVKTELIVDGVHLHPAIVQLVLRLKGVENVILVTDAMRAKCLGQGVYDLGGQAVQVEAGAARLADGTLAGSVLRMPEAIHNIVNFTGCDFQSAINMAAANPAKVLGIFDRKGSIALGKDADLVVLDDKGGVVMTMVKGHIVYQNRAEKYLVTSNESLARN